MFIDVFVLFFFLKPNFGFTSCVFQGVTEKLYFLFSIICLSLWPTMDCAWALESCNYSQQYISLEVTIFPEHPGFISSLSSMVGPFSISFCFCVGRVWLISSMTSAKCSVPMKLLGGRHRNILILININKNISYTIEDRFMYIHMYIIINRWRYLWKIITAFLIFLHTPAVLILMMLCTYTPIIHSVSSVLVWWSLGLSWRLIVQRHGSVHGLNEIYLVPMLTSEREREERERERKRERVCVR